MRILGVMPVRDEADRWLDASLSWQKNFLDDIFVYDDRSTDRTLQIALKHTPNVKVRSEDEPSFLEHEGKFRQNCWNLFCHLWRCNGRYAGCHAYGRHRILNQIQFP